MFLFSVTFFCSLSFWKGFVSVLFISGEDSGGDSWVEDSGMDSGEDSGEDSSVEDSGVDSVVRILEWILW